MTQDRLWIACSLAGLATLITAIFIMPMFPQEMAGDLQGFGAPVYAFEFARTPDDMIAIFGAADDPLRVERLAMMDRGNRWDFLFITLYTAFGVLFGLAAARTNAAMGRLVLLFAGMAGAADLVETGTLLALSEELADGGAALPGLGYVWIVASVKFAALSLSIIFASLFIARQGGKLWKLAAYAAILAVLLILPSLVAPARYASLLGLAVGLGWIVMLGFATTKAMKAFSRRP